MNKKLRLTTLVLATGLLAGSSAFAQLTRDQVIADMIEAQRTGNIVTGLDGNKKLNELEPARYASQQAAQGKTRAQVRAELIEAQQKGEIVTGLDGNKTLRELDPARFQRAEQALAKTGASAEGTALTDAGKDSQAPKGL